MAFELTRYNSACRAIAEARAIDEVKDIHDFSIAMDAYARQARNKDLEIEASEIRFRAERRIGELIREQGQMGLLAVGTAGAGRPKLGGSETDPPKKRDERPSLNDAGIDKHLADRARKYAAVPDDQFRRMMADRRARIEKERARVTLHLIEDDKARRRAARESALGAKILALPKKKYGVIYADPEWQFQVWSRETGSDRSASNHYACSAIDVIKARDVPSIAADDCALFLWSTVPVLPMALEVMVAWGFSYRTSWAWIKDRIGMGFWNRSRHELLLLGTRGDVPCPAPGEQWESVIEAPRRGHSEKPPEVYEMIESYFPSLRKIELNARTSRPGWDAWGFEAPPMAKQA